MYWITGILGLLLVVAPFILSFSGNAIALWSSIILGVAVAIVSGIKAIAHDSANWEYWIAGILGLLTILAPFVLGFNVITTALWTSIILGVIIVILAGYEVFFAPHSHA